MAIIYWNVVSGEKRVADTEPMIAAMYNSSDRGVNARNGQDFGWRLAPEVVLSMKRISKDEEILYRIAAKIKKSPDEVSEVDVLKYISDMTKVEDAPVALQSDYEDEYKREIEKLEKKDAKKAAKVTEDEDTDIEKTASK